MIVNIPKYEQGGSALPLVDYMPYQGMSGSTAAASSSSASSDDSLGLKDLMKITEQMEGLPSDLSTLTKSIKELYEEASLFNNGKVDTNDLVTTYLSALQKAKVAKFNQTQFDKVQSEVTNNGGLHEIAIDEKGKLFIQDKESGKTYSMTVDEYNQLDHNKYEALTNSNLLYERAHSDSLSFNNNFLTVISNGVGEKKVTELLLQVAGSLGKDTLQQEGYSEKTADKIIEGMGVLQAAYEGGMTVDGLYKQSILKEDQKSQVQSALNYLWSTLPTNVKTFLAYKSGNKDSEQGGKLLMADLLNAKTSSVNKYTQDLVKNPGKESSGEGGLSGGVNLDAAKAFILGMGYQKDFTINTGNSYNLKLTGNYGVLTNHSGEALGEFSTLKDVSSSSFAGNLDLNNATIGGARISTLNKAYLNNADVIGVDLPIDSQYYEETGIIRPDMSLMSKVEKLQELFNMKQVDKNDANAVNAACQQLGLPNMYNKIDENGIPQLDKSNFARFARIDGFVDESALVDKSTVDDTVQTLDKNRRDNFKEYMKAVDKNYSISEGFMGMGKDELIEGAIYIPVRSDIIASSVAGSNYYKLPDPNAITTAQKWADNKKVQNYQKTPSLSSLINQI